MLRLNTTEIFIEWMNSGDIQVRMAERSKAPDSSLACAASAYECSGLHLEAWVRIPLLTKFCVAVIMLKSWLPRTDGAKKGMSRPFVVPRLQIFVEAFIIYSIETDNSAMAVPPLGHRGAVWHLLFRRKGKWRAWRDNDISWLICRKDV